MEGFAKHEQSAAASGKRCQLYGIFICFRARVAEKQLIIGIARHLSQYVGQTLLKRVDHRVGVKPRRGHLTAHRINVAGMSVTYGDHGMTSVEIEIFCAVGGIDIIARAAHRLYII